DYYCLVWDSVSKYIF
nr:immunoglobulin light chain junction region [Macaca mulatta]MOX12813.1 immunoglobulin light chain junction region [Macaca mulatta]MOX13170.1 immunoglobulin light chain junction region [Macaca mulatta]MOX13187.1 immunoglobulin light chain junction region [Macaca mulatta]MOX13524.1 immunoglobulin light chain junction region [Macaca mulatta]